MSDQSWPSALRALPHGLGRTRLTPALLPPLYLAVTGFTALLGLVAIVAAVAHAWWLGVVALLVVPVLVVCVVASARVIAELTLAIFNLSEQVTAAMPRLEKTVDHIAAEMPRLRLFRPRGNGQER